MSGTTHISLDLETLGTGSNAAIVSIGAVEFHAHGVGRAFHQNVTFTSAVAHGFVDGDTIRWWLGQSDAARQSLVSGSAQDLPEVLYGLNEWVQAMTPNGDVRLWGNGASFDCVVLENAYKRAGIDPFFTFRQHRDLRTLLSLVPENSRKLMWASPTVAHDALSDATAQALTICNAYKYLGVTL